MKLCSICDRNIYLLKEINGDQIWECRDCSVAYTRQEKTYNIYNNKIDYKINTYRRLEKYHEKQFRNIINTVTRFISSGNLLEVGAGFGLFSSLLSEYKNYSIEVIEPHLSLYFLKNNQKVIMHRKKYEEFLKENKKKYDGVFFLDVLEHFDRPDDILRRTRKILSINGYLILQLPNYRSLMARICKDWSWWMVSDHKIHFSPRSAKLLLEKEGYMVRYITTYEPWYDFKKNLDGNFTYIQSSMLRKSIKLVFFLLFVPFYFLFRSLVWRSDYGGLLLIIAKKL
ncbi:MAG: class I SAM-dependent methyltransferase [bacterium]|nr:class I SAM-dependent methyltransferase [bacterium]